MNTRFVVAFLLLSVPCAAAQSPVKIGELNSYKVFPAFLEPYKKGMELALEEINGAGGVLGRKLELVSRDDGGTPGDAVRVAEELIAREGATVLMGTFASNVGLAVSNLAAQRKILFVASEPLTDKIVWENGNRYTFRLRPSTYMQTAMLMPEAVKLKKRRWAIVYPNYEYGQSATASFKKLLTQAQPGVEFVAEQAPALGKIDAGAVVQALADAKPDAIFSSLFAADLQKFVREGNTARPVQEHRGVQPARRRAGIPRYAQGRDARRLVGHRLSLERDQHAGAQDLPRRLPETLEGLPAPGLGRGLHGDLQRRQRDPQGEHRPTPRS